ncbi:MAG: diaminopimelate decarboxylase [bacterium]|nr:diaminopimelate decarboxylase [Deltaproteobacteria bacterium]MCP4908691.1 diaminopimelate decarboxylase [bacterium]
MNEAQIGLIRERFGTPVYVYDQATLEAAADEVLAFPAPCRLVGRFAMKACPTAAVLHILSARGLHIDASSGFEAERALHAGIAAERIQITAQEIPKDLKGLVQRGVLYNACSLHQLRAFGELCPGRELSIRANPGLGSGHNNRTNTGGPSTSFGIWHERLEEALAIAQEFGLTLSGLHTHIGSGGDPDVWKRCAEMTVDIATRLPDLNRLSLGGGFKVARMPEETSADLQTIGAALRPTLETFIGARKDFQLEIEPGTFLVANAGAILAEIIDVVDTHSATGAGSDGHTFLKIDSGMTELLRPSVYGAQHPLTVVAHGHPAASEETDYLVAGHCCESGDILTPAPGDPEGLAPRRLARAEIGDTLVIEGAGAYASGMAAKNYNAFPEAAEVLIDADGEARLVRRRQTLGQMLQNEL